jgi:hypothetical protein
MLPCRRGLTGPSQIDIDWKAVSKEMESVRSMRPGECQALWRTIAYDSKYDPAHLPAEPASEDSDFEADIARRKPRPRFHAKRAEPNVADAVAAVPAAQASVPVRRWQRGEDSRLLQFILHNGLDMDRHPEVTDTVGRPVSECVDRWNKLLTSVLSGAVKHEQTVQLVSEIMER